MLQLLMNYHETPLFITFDNDVMPSSTKLERARKFNSTGRGVLKIELAGTSYIAQSVATWVNL